MSAVYLSPCFFTSEETTFLVPGDEELQDGIYASYLGYLSVPKRRMPNMQWHHGTIRTLSPTASFTWKLVSKKILRLKRRQLNPEKEGKLHESNFLRIAPDATSTIGANRSVRDSSVYHALQLSNVQFV
ncbi:hypothetical protein Agabi119p4_1265 [Agaricus bisporus var. burnettii]|uniref:Uncharacterized protein n=1 Tax=Agaricus bisporus var. burnettii TaxID=192524 RepID=A0A8H7FC44_AGABI|nr:hypothetical protein Agabi119p4_1265 [Agaricus bisporus var. burnettii]